MFKVHSEETKIRHFVKPQFDLNILVEAFLAMQTASKLDQFYETKNKWFFRILLETVMCCFKICNHFQNRPNCRIEDFL